jgi:hypothetical protein
MPTFQISPSIKRRESTAASVNLQDYSMSDMRTVLEAYGEDPQLAYLFSVAFGEMSVTMDDGNVFQENDDSRTKMNLFRALLRRLLIKFTTMARKTILLFDDAQWIDAATMSLVAEFADSDAEVRFALRII